MRPRRSRLQPRKSRITPPVRLLAISPHVCSASAADQPASFTTTANTITAAFVQDDYKVSSRLTMNLGVRWEFDGTYNDKYGNLTNVWPNLWLSGARRQPRPVPTGSRSGWICGAQQLCRRTTDSRRPAFRSTPMARPISGHPPFSNFAPRVGFAWQPTDNGKLVIRGGAGLFYDRIAGDRFVHGLEQGYPYSITLDYSVRQTRYSNQNPYPPTPLSFPPRWYNTATLTGSHLNQAFLDPDIHTPLVRQYNVNIQYEFAPTWVLEVGYVGSSGINLVDTYHDYNIPLLASSQRSRSTAMTTNTLAKHQCPRALSGLPCRAV